MVRGFAGGFGYDKRSAACANAAPKLKLPPEGSTLEWERAQYANGFAAFVEALEHDGGESWEMRLYQAGFTVLQAV